MRTWRKPACLGLCAVLVWFLAEAGTVRSWTGEALVLCAGTVLPALFPFLAVSRLLVDLGLGAWLSPHLAGLMALFRLPGSAGTALVLGLVGGYPVGARTAADLYRAGLLTREEAERLLAFCNNSNPVFLISVLGSGVFGSVRAGVWLWLIHMLSALGTGLMFRRGKRPDCREAARAIPCQQFSFSSAVVEAVGGAGSAMVSVCAFVTLFYVLSRPLTFLGGRLGAALVGAVELFSLTPLVTPDRFGFVLASFCSGWGGLSVLCQTAAVLEGSGLSPRNCLLGKAVQGVLSAALAVLLVDYVLA